MEEWFRDVIILSVKSATKRREKIHRMMTKFGINKYRFYDAATSATDFRINDKLSKGAQGNIQSNINLFTELLQSDDPRPILFFEDDVDSLLSTEAIAAEFNQLFELIAQATRKPDMIHLGKCYDKCSMLQPIADKIYSASTPLCMHAVIIYPTAMQAFLKQKTYHNVADTIFKDLFLDGTLSPGLTIPVFSIKIHICRVRYDHVQKISPSVMNVELKLHKLIGGKLGCIYAVCLSVFC